MKQRFSKIKYYDSVCYLNLGILDTSDIVKQQNEILKSKGLIIDIRDNANNTLYCLSRILNPIEVLFVQFSRVDTTYPGCFNYSEIYKTGPKKYNQNYYKGKVCFIS